MSPSITLWTLSAGTYIITWLFHIKIDAYSKLTIGADRLWNSGTPEMEKPLKVLFKNSATAKKAGFQNKQSQAEVGMSNIDTTDETENQLYV